MRAIGKLEYVRAGKALKDMGELWMMALLLSGRAGTTVEPWSFPLGTAIGVPDVCGVRRTSEWWFRWSCMPLAYVSNGGFISFFC